jgi:hypothetical protein
VRDSDLQRRFREGTSPRGEIDVDAVLRRARARRRPKAVLAGAGSVLAIAAIAVPAVLTSSGGTGAGGSTVVAGDGLAPEAAPDTGLAGGDADQAMMERAPAERLNLCGAPVAEQVPSAMGLVITVAPVTASAAERGIPITVTLTNAGDERVTGTTGGRPAVTFARDGVTLWHTNGPQDLIARVVDLAPGQSMSYAAVFEPVVCAPQDDAAEAFRADLPPAGPGDYTLSAAIDVTSEDGATIEQVTGPPAAATLG